MPHPGSTRGDIISGVDDGENVRVLPLVFQGVEDQLGVVVGPRAVWSIGSIPLVGPGQPLGDLVGTRAETENIVDPPVEKLGVPLWPRRIRAPGRFMVGVRGRTKEPTEGGHGVWISQTGHEVRLPTWQARRRLDPQWAITWVRGRSMESRRRLMRSALSHREIPGANVETRISSKSSSERAERMAT